MTPPRTRRFAWLAVSAVSFHAAAMLALHVLVPRVDPVSEMVGAYLVGEYQWLSRATFFALGCAIGALGLGLRSYGLSGVGFKIALVLATIAVVGFFGVTAAPDLALYFAIPTQPATVLTIFVLSLRLRHEGPWKKVGPYLLAIAISLITLFVMTIALGILASAGLGGLANRMVLVLIYAWVLLVSRGLSSAAAEKRIATAEA